MAVATGTPRLKTSDVDVVTVGLPSPRAAVLQRELSARFAGPSRGVEIAVTSTEDYLGDGDQAYGNRVFLQHYCVHLAGPDFSASMGAFPADVRAARGFNGDIGQHWRDWIDLARNESGRGGSGPGILGRRVARKTLLAVAGLVSVQDATWTTDRGLAARRWAQTRPGLAEGLGRLWLWSEGATVATQVELEAVLTAGKIVDLVVQDFRDIIGLWA